MSDWKKIIVSGSDAELNSLYAPSITGSLHGTASWAQNSLTASYSPNLTISGSITSVNYIDFNTGSAQPAWKSGRVFWDNVDGALSVYNAEADITLQVGQENWTRVRNNTGTTITNGTIVRLDGSQGDVPTVERAQSLAMSGSVNVLNQILGVATHNIEDNSFGYVTTQGLVRGLNTNAFNDGDTLFVGTGSSGILTNIPPRAPYEIIPVGVCVKASPGTSGIIYVAVQQPIDFSDLSSVRVTGSYSYGDLWVYRPSGSFGVWEHTNQLSGSYGITGSLIISSSNNTNDFQVGSNKLFVSASGNVGIGITTPTAKLHVNNTGNINSFLVEDDTNPDATPFVIDSIGRVGIGTGSAFEKVTIQNGNIALKDLTNSTPTSIVFTTSDTSSRNYITTLNSSSATDDYMKVGSWFGSVHLTTGNITSPTTHLFVSRSGNIGVGITSSLNAKLHVNNTGTENSFLVEDSTNPDSSPFVVDAAGNVAVGSGSASNKFIVSNGTNDVFTVNTVNSTVWARGAGNVSSNTSFGENALDSNTTGTSNTAFGQNALTTVTTGSNNSAFGRGSLQSLNGNENGGFGISSLIFLSSGNSNVGLGFQSGIYITDGVTQLTNAGSSIFIGANTKALANNQTNQIVIGNNTTGNGSNSVTLGNDSITKTILRSNVGIGKIDPSTTLDISGSAIVTGSFDASSYSNKIIAITELTSSTLVTHTVGTTNFTAINLNSDGTNRFAKASFIAPLSGRVEISMEFDMTIVNSSAVQMIGLHNTSSATSTPSEGWYRVNADNDSTSGQFYAKFIETGLTPGTAYNYYFMGVCDFSGNTIRTSRIQTGAYAASSDLPSPLRIYVYDLGSALISTNPSS
jgi:hypothetical protein